MEGGDEKHEEKGDNNEEKGKNEEKALHTRFLSHMRATWTLAAANARPNARKINKKFRV